MKKTSLVVAVPVLAISLVTLSGCGMFRSHKQWEAAKQESPLEIPPGLDTPSTSAALVIPPPGANTPTANGATAAVGSAPATITDGFVLNEGVQNAYQRIGQALEAGDIGKVTAHDDASYSYQLDVVAPTMTKKPGFFGRMFGRGKKDEGNGNTYPVQLAISASGSNAAEVRAQGEPAAVAKVIDALKARLGG